MAPNPIVAVFICPQPNEKYSGGFTDAGVFAKVKYIVAVIGKIQSQTYRCHVWYDMLLPPCFKSSSNSRAIQIHDQLFICKAKNTS